jgi:hypothetical protein
MWVGKRGVRFGLPVSRPESGIDPPGIFDKHHAAYEEQCIEHPRSVMRRRSPINCDSIPLQFGASRGNKEDHKRGVASASMIPW